ncbi:MAG TPA: DUF1214 domain-containing protein [Myxococcales bacterium]|nr:DUF1214 domain-containing protein [Myxococcales bacterium]HIL00908.1 DUF1214 domain-containing protein [Myxococcales bacterium]
MDATADAVEGAAEAEARVLDGRAWSDFCDALKLAGDAVSRPGSPQDAFDRAEGYRYISRLVRVALESYIEFADPAAPVLRRPAHETVKIGADNPDNHYQSAAISGQYEYRIRGQRGSVYYLGLGTYAGNYGSDERRGQTGYIEASDLEIDSEGRFEIQVSCRRPASGKNWLPMERDTSSLIVRQTYQDRRLEQIADLNLERIGGSGPPAPLTPLALDSGLAAAAAYVRGTANLFCEWSEGFRGELNALPVFDPAVARAAHGDPHIQYYHGYWELGPDEALLIEVKPPVCEYWNFQLNNHWMESLDYRYHRIDLNHHAAVQAADGTVRLIVAHKDPGLPNWLDTASHRRGTMCLRWIRAQTHPQPVTRVLPLADLVAESAG